MKAEYKTFGHLVLEGKEPDHRKIAGLSSAFDIGAFETKEEILQSNLQCVLKKKQHIKATYSGSLQELQ